VPTAETVSRVATCCTHGASTSGLAAVSTSAKFLGRRVSPSSQPGKAPSPWLPRNSLLGIAAHALANTQENILGLLGGVAVERDHTAEFDDQQHTSGAIFQQWQELEPRLAKMVRELPESSLSAQVVHPVEAGSVGSRFS
jgi:hypothetical protein